MICTVNAANKTDIMPEVSYILHIKQQQLNMDN